jgi:hypothetical protein
MDKSFDNLEPPVSEAVFEDLCSYDSGLGRNTACV